MRVRRRFGTIHLMHFAIKDYSIYNLILMYHAAP